MIQFRSRVTLANRLRSRERGLPSRRRRPENLRARDVKTPERIRRSGSTLSTRFAFTESSRDKANAAGISRYVPGRAYPGGAGRRSRRRRKRFAFYRERVQSPIYNVECVPNDDNDDDDDQRYATLFPRERACIRANVTFRAVARPITLFTKSDRCATRAARARVTFFMPFNRAAADDFVGAYDIAVARAILRYRANEILKLLRVLAFRRCCVTR